MTNNRWVGVIVAIVLFALLIVIVVFAIVASDNKEQAADTDKPTVEIMAATQTATASPSASPTRVPTLITPSATVMVVTSAPTNSRNAAVVTTAPSCALRSDLPVYIVQNGDTLSGIAERAGVTTEELTAYNCLLDENRLMVGQTLYVPTIPNPPPTGDTTIVLVCETGWFFAFDAGQFDRLNACPDPVITVDAVGQNFQNGRIYIYAAPPITPDTRGITYVIYNDGTWEVYSDTWEKTDPGQDPNLIPPTGFFQPTEAIGKIWRENPSLQQKLGWAIELPVPFVGRTQLPAVAADYFYVDHGVQGFVLRLTSGADALKTWELVGRYTAAS